MATPPPASPPLPAHHCPRKRPAASRAQAELALPSPGASLVHTTSAFSPRADHRALPGSPPLPAPPRCLAASSRCQALPACKSDNMALVPCQVLRVAILLSYFSILCTYKAIDMPAHHTFGGSWKFLTFIDLDYQHFAIPVKKFRTRICFELVTRKKSVIQAVFFGICVLTDLSSLLTKGSDCQEQERQLKKLISLRDWMMAVLAFPVGVFVVIMFWSFYIYDREVIYPKLLDNFIPAWLNHGMHTTVLPFILIEMRTTHHQYPSRSCGLAAICTFSVGYILCYGRRKRKA
ncbi:androgen-induced gene 1 protein isoform X3 [Pelodiscus sinensis]|uniref:androgen-induced gene 1 protein isoform X3 n=1 Tax=Pelodiscus sinensis TaxID=13735 RepID=UPI003F6CC670